MPTSSLLDSSLDFASRDWRVLPVHTVHKGICSCHNQCGKPGKHPHIKDWGKRASSKTTQIKNWWKRWPDANIGIATGEQSGIFVVDIDGDQGSATLAKLMAERDWQPNTLTAVTGRGKHLYFLHPGKTLKNSAGRIGSGVDVRGEDGYVIAPPSRHVSGAVYRWEDPEKTVAVAPGWLIELVCSATSVKNVTPISVMPDGSDDVIPEGTRNDTLFKIGCGLRGRGREYQTILEELTEMNEEHCEPPLAVEEVEAIAMSAAEYPKGSELREVQGIYSEDNPLYWFPFDVKEWLSNREVTFMTDCQRGWYINLLAEAWTEGGTLPNEPAILHKIARAKCSLKKFRSELPAIMGAFDGFGCDTPRLVHRRLAKLWLEKKAIWDKRVAAGTKSGVTRKAAAQAKAAAEERAA
jgi:uncharacterized protein YdaU (DUF1376 family)